jgi:hypothetical protein
MAQDGRSGVGEGNGSQPGQKAAHESLNAPTATSPKNRAKRPSGRARALREGLASGAMRDRVWDRISRPSQKGSPQQTG